MKVTQSNVAAAVANMDINRLLEQKVLGGSAQTAMAKITFLGGEAAGDVIEVMDLPFGAVLQTDRCALIAGTAGLDLSITADLGDGTNVDRYADGVELDYAAAKSASFLDGGLPAELVTPTPVGDDTLKVYLTLTAATHGAGEDAVATAVAGAVLWVRLEYKMPI